MVCPTDKGVIGEYENLTTRKESPYLFQNGSELCLYRNGEPVRSCTSRYGQVWFVSSFSLPVWIVDDYDKKRTWKGMPSVILLFDAHTGALVSSCIVLHEPHLPDLIQVICNAAGITVDSPFCGMGHHIFFDPACSLYEEYRKKRETNAPWHHFEQHFLKMPGCSIDDAVPNDDWLRPLNLFVRNLHAKWLRHLPGYIGNRNPRKAYRAKKIVNQLIRDERLVTYEFLQEKWRGVIVPSFNTLPRKWHPRHGTASDTTPVALYEPNPHLIVPSWACLAAFSETFTAVTVHPDGIRANKSTYASPQVMTYVTDSVYICRMSNCRHDPIHAVYVDSSSRSRKNCHSFYIGPLGETEAIRLVNAHRFKLARAGHIRKEQEGTIRNTVSAIRYLAKLMKLDRQLYIDYDPVHNIVMPTYYDGPNPEVFEIPTMTPEERLREEISVLESVLLVIEDKLYHSRIQE